MRGKQRCRIYYLSSWRLLGAEGLFKKSGTSDMTFFDMGNIEVCVIIKHNFFWLRPTFIPGAAWFDVAFLWMWLILAAYF